MTTEQHPGGVAGRILSEQRDKIIRIQKDPHKISASREKQQYTGMRKMHRELSREARAIRDEEVEHPSDNSILVNGKLYVRLSHMTDRFGLTLTEPDTGGDGGCGMPYGVFGEGEPDNE